MELWIRSQDKTILSKAQNIIIRENKNENNETNYAIVDIYTMGIYKSKERALEVLDEIQSKIATLNFQNHFIGTDFNIIESNIYQMPEK